MRKISYIIKNILRNPRVWLILGFLVLFALNVVLADPPVSPTGGDQWPPGDPDPPLPSPTPT